MLLKMPLFHCSLWLSNIHCGLSGWVSNNLSATKETRFNSWVGKIPCRRKWQPTPVLLPRESHGQRWATVCGVTKSQTWLSDREQARNIPLYICTRSSSSIAPLMDTGQQLLKNYCLPSFGEIWKKNIQMKLDLLNTLYRNIHSSIDWMQKQIWESNHFRWSQAK